FRRERDDLHEALGAELAGDGAEDTRAHGLELVVDEDGAVVVELDVAAVGAAVLAPRADDDGTRRITLLHLAARERFLDADDDHVAQPGVTPTGAAQHLDALDALRTRVVRDIEERLHLDHGIPPLKKARSPDARSAARPSSACGEKWDDALRSRRGRRP